MQITIGKVIGDVWIEMLFDKNSHPDARKQALHHRILADMKRDKYFEPFEGKTLRVGERRWVVNA